ncbi:hypothetical protein CTAYLR_009974 [Chrysophaeum taylorii]|uniref:RidA family protein n=1 Tax=Chrysophaeum taylorii TaxID=2483200 RepID=A0AAD7U6S7_9STRA|nr:hypothetical protein CTAYLR_009974 [Chrysophaeum taylorii]
MGPNALFPEGKRELFERLGYSPAVRAGDFLFVAGQVGVADGAVVEDPESQFRLAFEKVVALLEVAGMGTQDIVDVKTFHVDMEKHLDAFNKVKNEFFPRPPFPCFTGLIEVNRLGMKGLLLEVAATAYKKSSTE